jgi:formylglycine-generating enzyme
LGSPPNEAGRFSDEGPQISITIKAPFAVGKFPITISDFSAFISDSGYKLTPDGCYVLRTLLQSNAPQYPSNSSVRYATRGTRQQWQYGWDNSRQYDPSVAPTVKTPRYVSTPGYSWRNPGFAQTKRDPVVCVNWYDATAYATWLSKKTGKDYRLMSESEFEYMARGQTDTGCYRIFSFGNDSRQLCRFGNGNPKFTDTSGNSSYYCDDGYQFTSPVGTYQPNAFGIYDVFGNALEWTQDCYHNSHSGNPVTGLHGFFWIASCDH